MRALRLCVMAAAVALVVLSCTLPGVAWAEHNGDEDEDPDGYTLGYKRTCPMSVSPLCSPGNKCDRCHHTCLFCQNLSNDTCGASDCMVCRKPYYLLTKFTDGTGLCVSQEDAYLPTCPKTNSLCQPGNRCMLCPGMCSECQGPNMLCGPVECTACQNGYALHLHSSEHHTGECRRKERGFKPTCPEGAHDKCSPWNQCSSCAQGCSLCQNQRTNLCGADDCLACESGFAFQRTNSEAGTGACVRSVTMRFRRAHSNEHQPPQHQENSQQHTKVQPQRAGAPVDDADVGVRSGSDREGGSRAADPEGTGARGVGESWWEPVVRYLLTQVEEVNRAGFTKHSNERAFEWGDPKPLSELTLRDWALYIPHLLVLALMSAVRVPLAMLLHVWKSVLLL